MVETPVSTVALIGVGLMGGSLGLAARERAGVADVRGFSQTQATLDLALERGAITTACESIEEACAGADLIFVCTPVRMVIKHVREALAAAPPHAVVTDVGSTKGPLMRALSPEEQRRCIGGHPLCGSETAGVANARASLYQGATYFVTPGDARGRRRLPARCTGSWETSAPVRWPSTRRSTTARWPSSATCRTCWPTC